MPLTTEELMLEILKEVREDQKAHSTILIEVQKDVARNTDDLEVHILGVNQNRTRIEELEKPFTYMHHTKRIILTLGGLFGAVYAMIKLVEYFKG